jgi:hypothetical protein
VKKYRSLDEGRDALLDQLHNVFKDRDVTQWVAANFDPSSLNEVSKFMDNRCLRIGRRNLRIVFRQMDRG